MRVASLLVRIQTSFARRRVFVLGGGRQKCMEPTHTLAAAPLLLAVHPLPTHLYHMAFAKVSENEYVG